MFTFLCWLCLCGNKEYPNSFQNKSVSSSFKWVPSQVMRKRRPLWSGQAYVNYYKSVHHPIFLLCLWEQGTPWQFSKQISKLSFQLSFQIYSLLDQTERERKVLFGGCKKGDHIVRLCPRALGCCKIWKSLFFCEIWNNPTPPLFFIRTPLQISTAGHGVLW